MLQKDQKLSGHLRLEIYAYSILPRGEKESSAYGHLHHLLVTYL